MSKSVFCNRCGAESALPGAVFCNRCGARLAKRSSTVGEFLLSLVKCLGYYAVFLGVSLGVDLVYTTFATIRAAAAENTAVNKLTEEALYAEYSRYAPQVSIFSALLVLVIYVIIFRARGKRLAKEIRLKGLNVLSGGAMIAMGASAQFLVALLLTVLYAFYPSLSEYSNSDTFEMIFQNSDPLFQFLHIAVMTPIIEEVLFRGLIHTRLRRTVSPALAVILSSLIFGVAHGNAEQFVYTCLVGALMGAAYEKYGSIIAPILIHAAFNGTSFVLQYLNFKYSVTYLFFFAAATGLFLVCTSFVFCAKNTPYTPNAKERS